MNFCVRPSKSFLFDLLEKKLKKINHGIGLDAGSASMKNRRMFKTNVYYGLDINLPALQSGLKNKTENTFGILGDLTDLGLLPDNSFDVIVSTNTLYALPPEKRGAAIKRLCALTAPDGKLFCELNVDKDLSKSINIVKENFKTVKIIYYGNVISRAYEFVFEKNGYLGTHAVAGTRPFRLFAWLISRLEYLTCIFVLLNSHAFIAGDNKIFTGKKNIFNAADLSLCDKSIYTVLSK